MNTPIRVVAVALGLVLPQMVHAQTNWPTKPIRVLVPYAVGGATDIVIRLMQPAMNEMLGQAIVVENRPSATGNLAVEAVAKALPDGHTVLIGNITTNAINPVGLAHALNFDPTKELVGVTLLISVPTIVVGAPNLPPNNFKELIDLRWRVPDSSIIPIRCTPIRTWILWISPDAPVSRRFTSPPRARGRR